MLIIANLRCGYFKGSHRQPAQPTCHILSELPGKFYPHIMWWRRRGGAQLSPEVVERAAAATELSHLAQARFEQVVAVVDAGGMPAAGQLQAARDLMVLLAAELQELRLVLPAGRPENSAIAEVVADTEAAVEWLDDIFR